MPPAEKKQSRGKYTTKACEECRRRRAKCDGKKPSCSRCLQWSISCQYSSNEDGRRPASKSYVDLLRQRIQFLEDFLAKRGLDPDAEKSLGEDAAEVSYMEALCDQFKGRLALDESLNFDADGEMRFFGPTSGRLQFAAQGISPEKDSNARVEAEPLASTAYDAFVPTELETHLIDLYFAWEQPWYQIVDEELFRESMANRGRYFTPLLLYSILAMGSRYSDRVETRTDANDPNTAGRFFLEQAKTLLHGEMERPSLTTIQALGLIGMFYIATGADAAGWLHHGMANRLSLDMGLNLDPAAFEGAVSMSPKEMQLRRQIYWTLYCHDKLSASYTGRVCSMLDVQGAVNLPSHAEPSSPRQQAILSLQIALIRICQIYERILMSLWAPKPSLNQHQRPTFLKSCLLDLKTWLYDLPPALRIDQPNPLPHAYTLHMVFHTARILLAKPFTVRHQSASNDADANGGAQTQTQAQSVSTDSARAICTIAQKYRQHFASFHLSPITATHCTLSAATVLLEDIAGEDMLPSQKSRLEVCVGVLEELAGLWQPARRIGTNLRRLLRTRYNLTLPGSSTEGQLQATGDGLLAPSTGFDFVDEWNTEFLPQYAEGLPAALSLPPALDSLPVDYGLFDLLNRINMDRMW
ncbi:Zn(II)2Cys6 transcription factor [Aspergillus fischeri NRRL 181]|uniref:Fungal specific transcription factor, putative n=1 Tax=Neosartorya fischeri (strain ATCC 1020 / DSM 3700 / CBS 544.65 / FGSC A1164 / JCM 1740 / NRRL 181 / WB 181) TaxID=331117 RepID=A1D9U2_NEOFI|nr:fungal specific transcription factor, putative [Aspergillus fischeri NRRL 181]EAW20573.1 fungal specific transcription factor, putative [Aspergillus fischeri NRRL 181]